MFRVLLLLSLAICLQACRTFPEVEKLEQTFDAKQPYPDFVPLDLLLKEPVASITPELEAEMTADRDALQNTPAGTGSKDPLQDRIDALDKKRAAAKNSRIDDATRKRMENGITAPSSAGE